jgi:broad specificity phosphatase PhoE
MRLFAVHPWASCRAMTGVTLVRHGETTGQSSTRYYGATDVPLSEVGCAQMRRVRAALARSGFDAVFTSRLRRSVEAAEIIAGDGTPVVQVPAFDEVNFGRWEGMTREEIAARDPDNFHAWQNRGADFCYPGGESRRAFQARVAGALRGILHERPGAKGLFVVHKGVIAVILSELLRLTAEQRAGLDIDLGSIHVLTHRNGGWEADALNRVEHLLEGTSDK